MSRCLAPLLLLASSAHAESIAITGMTFHRPVFIGDEVSCYAAVAKIGWSSITIHIETWVRRHLSSESFDNLSRNHSTKDTCRHVL